MIRGLFKLKADREKVAALNGAPLFQFYMEKLRSAYDQAVVDTLHCGPRDLPDRRAYARCLKELIDETTKPPGAIP